MYFPIFKSKQEEKIAFSKLMENKILKKEKIVPIIDPFSNDEEDLYNGKNLISLINSFIENEINFICIVQKEEDLEKIKLQNKKLDDFCIYGLNYEFIASHKFDENKKYAIFHSSTIENIIDNKNILFHIFMPEISSLDSEINKYISTNKVVVIQDPLIVHEANKFYGDRKDIFSDLLVTYKNKKYLGFGDFMTSYSDFESARFADWRYITPTIHLTIFEKNKLYLQHFSVLIKDERDMNRRITLLIDKVIANKNLFLYSDGIKLIENKKGQTTNLGFFKRVSFMHHVELVLSLI